LWLSRVLVLSLPCIPSREVLKAMGLSLHQLSLDISSSPSTL